MRGRKFIELSAQFILYFLRTAPPTVGGDPQMAGIITFLLLLFMMSYV